MFVDGQNMEYVPITISTLKRFGLWGGRWTLVMILLQWTSGIPSVNENERRWSAAVSHSIFSWTQDPALFATLWRFGNRSIFTSNRMCQQHSGCWQIGHGLFGRRKSVVFIAHYLDIENRSRHFSPWVSNHVPRRSARTLDAFARPKLPCQQILRCQCLGCGDWDGLDGNFQAQTKTHRNKIIQPSWSILISQFQQSFDILTKFTANFPSILSIFFDRNRRFLDPLPREKKMI